MKTKDFLKAKEAELKRELEELKKRVGDEAKEAVDELEAKIEDALHGFDSVFDEELAEFKAVGLFNWIKLNPKKFAGLVGLTLAALNGVLAVVGLNFGL